VIRCSVFSLHQSLNLYLAELSEAPIGAHGCGLSPAEFSFEQRIVSRGGHTAGNHLLISSFIGG